MVSRHPPSARPRISQLGASHPFRAESIGEPPQTPAPALFCNQLPAQLALQVFDGPLNSRRSVVPALKGPVDLPGHPARQTGENTTRYGFRDASKAGSLTQ